MIKRTIYLGNPSYLSLSKKQLYIRQKADQEEQVSSIPIEDIGLVIADHPQITITHGLITALQENNTAILWCGANHMPLSINLPLQANDTFTAKVRYQVNASDPLKKQLWKQTVVSKIKNQTRVLDRLGFPSGKLEELASQVKSGDQDNAEGQAAAIYWQYLLSDYEVKRGRYEGGPNALFNYGYAILRAVMARSLVGSGCLPVLGIHHRNQYNPYCLADDVMEPYRPIVDWHIVQYLTQNPEYEGKLSKNEKAYLLNIPVLDVHISGKASPLMVGAQRTTASLVKCYEGKSRKIHYPEIQ